MVTVEGSGRCHGPGCTHPAVDEWCSPACEQAWNDQFHWLLGAAPAMPTGGLLSAVSAAEATVNLEETLPALAATALSVDDIQTPALGTGGSSSSGLTLTWVPSPADPDAPTPAEMDAGIQIGGVVPPGERITATFEADPMEAIRGAYERLGPIPPPPEPVRLTRSQFDALRGDAPAPDSSYRYGGPIGDLTGVPIELVDTVEESTLYLSAVAPDDEGIDVHRVDMEEIRAHREPRRRRWWRRQP